MIDQAPTAVWSPDRGSSELAEMAFRQHQVDGRCPNVRVLTSNASISTDVLLDDSWTIERRVIIDDRGGVVTAHREGIHVLVRSGPTQTVVEIAGPSWESVASTAGEFELLLSPTVERTPSLLPIMMWYSGSAGPVFRRSDINCPAWDEVKGTYPAKVAGALDDLMTFDANPDGGRLLLWHGAPGTGKTSAIRTLARAWAHDCFTEVIVDPEEFFTSPGYMAKVISSRIPQQWKLVVAEDCDRFLTTDATGAAKGPLGQLLSLTDGLVGQGTNTLVLITTNLNVRQVHPALVRPGRCLSSIEFTTLTAQEAVRLTGNPQAPPMTLAEVYHYRATGVLPDVGEPAYGYA